MSIMNLNLLPSKAKFQAAKIKLKTQVNKIAIGLVAAWVVACAIVLGVNFFIKYKLANAVVQNKKIQENYTGLQSNILVSQKLKYKAKMVGGVLASRFEYGKAFEMIENMFPEVITLDDYDLKEDGTFRIDGTTKTREGVDLVENTIESINSDKNKALTGASLTSLKNFKGVWSFTIVVTLK